MTHFSARHTIPMELVNKILIMRPEHPLANLFGYHSKTIYSTWDIEKKIFLVINNTFSICISGNDTITVGEVCILDEDAKCNLPHASSGIEEVDLVSESYNKIF